MIKNIAIGVLTLTTVAGGVWGYQNNQKAVILEVLLGEQTKAVAALEAEKADTAALLKTVQGELDIFKAAEEAKNSAVVSEADLKEFGESCKEWIAREFGDDDRPAYTKLMTNISDSWVKDGRLVFEVSTPSRSVSSQSMFLCVVDKEKGSMFKPSAFETASWRKDR